MKSGDQIYKDEKIGNENLNISLVSTYLSMGVRKISNKATVFGYLKKSAKTSPKSNLGVLPGFA